MIEVPGPNQIVATDGRIITLGIAGGIYTGGEAMNEDKEMVPVSQLREVEARAERAEAANLALRTELANVKRMWRETIDDKLILRVAMQDIAINANGADYGIWANRKAQKALDETEEKG